MKKIRKIFAKWIKEDISFLAKYDISITEGYNSFFIEEGEIYHEMIKNLMNPDYSFISRLSKNEFSDNFAVVKFENDEIKSASYYSIFLKHIGYPQPDGNFNYRERVYEFSCPIGIGKGCCGFHNKQKDAFYINKIPKFNKKNLLFSLHWEPDVILIQKDFFSKFFEPRGYKSLPVFKKLGKEEVKDIVQLVVPICKSPLDLSNSWYRDTKSICKCCGTVRYSNQTCDFLPPFENSTAQELCLSQEIFGSGGSSFRRIIITKEFFSELSKHFSYPEWSLMPSRD